MENKKEVKRVVINKPKLKMCDICKEEISLYSLSSHIKWTHNMTSDEYVKLYGEFRQIKPISNRKVNKITCQLCKTEFSTVGLFTHLRDTHNMSTDEYTSKFGEYRPNELRKIEYKNRLDTIDDNKKQTCVICNMQFASGILLGYHIKNDHSLDKKEYINRFVFNGIRPKCGCGCGRNVRILKYYPYKMDYVSGHNKSTLGFKFSDESKLKMSEKAIERIERGIGKTIDTIPELRFKSILDRLNVKYEHPYHVNLGNRIASIDFYISEINILIEIDGEYWHPDTLENLNFHTISNVISDKQRECLPNLVRIRSLELEQYEKIDTKETFLKAIQNSLKPDNVKILSYDHPIINKEYFKVCIDKKGNDYLKDNVWLLLKFIRAFQPKLPYPDLEEDLDMIYDKISNYDLNGILKDGNIFSNNIPTHGHNYLKHYFHSYWKSSYKGELSPMQCWENDDVMKKVIEYRIGCNNSGEIFDFSLLQLIRGISAIRKTISFFKPLLAAAIYKHYLKDRIEPVVLDPCAGFGGRMVGFKSVYRGGGYIGCEPNIETYNELCKMIEREDLSKCVVYNCKFEDLDISKLPPIDLTFTSIPYFDLETYSNPTNYYSFDHWKDIFITSLYKAPNCHINVNKSLCEKLTWEDKVEYYISSNKSHFDKTEGQKLEPIVKLS